MVVLSIAPHRGNSARSFPSTGFLGLTPVTLAGTVRTKVQEDKRVLEASSVVIRVRCYESTGQFSASAASPAFSNDSDPLAARPIPPLPHEQPTSDVFALSTSHAVTDVQSDTRPLLVSASSSSSSSSSSSASTASDGFNGIASASASDTQTSATSPSASDSEPVTRSNKAKTQDRGRVLYEQSVTVWTPECGSTSRSAKGKAPQTEQQYGHLGDFSAPWRLFVPVDAVRHGARSTMVFRTWRIWWAVEAIVFHKPAGVHGDRLFRSQQLTLLNYSPVDWNSLQKPKPVAWSVPSSSKTLPDYKVTMQTTANTIGAADPVEFVYHVRRHTHTDSPKRLVVELRREISYLAAGSSGTGDVGDPLTPPAGRRGDHLRTRGQASAAQAHATVGISRQARPKLFFTTSQAQASTDDVLLATFDTNLDFASKASCRGSLYGHMPQTRSVYHYAVGESCRTPTGQARFYFVTKLLFDQDTETVTSTPRDIKFTTVSEDDRSRARAQLGRVLAIQEAEERIFGDNEPELIMSDDESMLRHGRETDGQRLPAARRHSDQTDGNVAPRTPAILKMSDVSAALSPVLSVSSPTFSEESAATFRPRSVHRGRGGHRTLRPKSASGWSLASSKMDSTRSFDGGQFMADVGELPNLASVLLPTSSPVLQKSDQGGSLFNTLQGFTLQTEQQTRSGVEHSKPEKRRSRANGHFQALRAADAAAAGKQSRDDAAVAHALVNHRILEQNRDESPSRHPEARRKSSTGSGLSNFFRRGSRT